MLRLGPERKSFFSLWLPLPIYGALPLILSLSHSLWGFGLFALKSKMRRQPGILQSDREREGERGKRDKERCLDPTTMQQTFHPLPSVHRALLLSLLPLLHLSLFLSLFLLRLVIIIIFSFLLALGLDATRLDSTGCHSESTFVLPARTHIA